MDADEQVAAIEAAMAPGAVQTPSEPKPAEVVPATPPVAEEPAVVPLPEEEEETPSGAPKRISMKGLPDADRYKIASAISLAKAEGISFEEATARLAPPKVEAAPAAPDPVAVLEAEAAEIEARLDAAAADNSLFTPELRKDLKRQTEIERQITKENFKRDKAEAVQVQTVQQKYDADWDASVATAIATYAEEHTKAGSTLANAVSSEVEKIASNPLHPLYGNSELPELLFAKHAARLGIPPKARVTPPVSGRVLPASGASAPLPSPVQNEATQKEAYKIRMAQAFKSGDPDEAARIAEEELTGKPASSSYRTMVNVR